MNTVTQLTNIETLGLAPSESIDEIGDLRRQLRSLSLYHVQRIVKKALYDHTPPEFADRVINYYRRSDGSDSAAEENFLTSDLPYFELIRDEHYQRALTVVERLFRPSRRLKPVSFPDLRYYPWTLNTSAEAPYTHLPKWSKHVAHKQSVGQIQDGAISFHNLYNEIFHINRQHVHIIKRRMQPFWDPITWKPEPYYWSTLHTRAHLVTKEDPDKNRSVFGVTKLLLMTENMFLWPLQKEYLNRRVKSPMLWGYETIRGGWYKLWRDLHLKGPHSTYLAVDWSSFDNRALHAVIDDVHTIWRQWFDFDQGYEPTNIYPDSTTNSDQINALWEWMTYSVKHTPIKGPSGKLYKWRFNGIASGFQQTQLLGSFVNAIMILTILSHIGINIDSDTFTLFVQGDDSLTAFNETPIIFGSDNFLNRLTELAMLLFNAKLSNQKTCVGPHLNDIKVLSYGNRNGFALRDPHELLAHLLYPERHRDLAATAASAIGIATASMGCSPLVYKVCQDVHRFITQELGVVPAERGVRWITRMNVDIDLSRFPLYDETLAQNLTLLERSESEKNRLWPTTPVGISLETPRGFYFLNP